MNSPDLRRDIFKLNVSNKDLHLIKNSLNSHFDDINDIFVDRSYLKDLAELKMKFNTFVELHKHLFYELGPSDHIHKMSNIKWKGDSMRPEPITFTDAKLEIIFRPEPITFTFTDAQLEIICIALMEMAYPNLSRTVPHPLQGMANQVLDELNVKLGHFKVP